MKLKLPLPMQAIDGHITCGYSNTHRAIDLTKVPVDSPVYATLSGTVDHVDNIGASTYGKWIRLKHSKGVETRYAHLNSTAVKVGQYVTAGEVIGAMGFTGNVIPKGEKGAHLHFELIIGGAWVDPEPYLRGELDVPSDLVPILLGQEQIGVATLINNKAYMGDTQLRDFADKLNHNIEWRDHPQTLILIPRASVNLELLTQALGHCEVASRLIKGALERA